MPVARLGAIGDIHAEDDALAKSIAHLRALGVEVIVAVGDIVDGRGDVDRCCRLLRDEGVVTVRGNHERWLFRGEMRDLPEATRLEALSDDAKAFLRSLPATETIGTVAGELLVCHGIGENDMASVRPFDSVHALGDNAALDEMLRSSVTVMVSGHSHERLVRTLGPLTIVNAGTLHRDDAPGFCLLDLEGRTVDYFDIDSSGGIRPGPSFTFGRAGQDLWDAGF